MPIFINNFIHQLAYLFILPPFQHQSMWIINFAWIMALQTRSMQLKTSSHNPINRQQILDLLSLKQDILDYEIDVQDHNNSLQLNSLLTPPAKFPFKQDKYRRRRPKAKTQHQQPTKHHNAHSERVLKRRQLIDDNKNQLKSGMARNNTEPPRQGKGDGSKKGYVSLKAKRPQSAIERGHYRSLASKPPPSRQVIDTTPTHEDRLIGFKKQYQSACRVEKIRPTPADKQHIEIENIVEALKAQKGVPTEVSFLKPAGEEGEKVEKLGKVVGNVLGVRGVERRVGRLGRGKLKSSLKPGKLLKERYRLQVKIGEGLSGEVWKGEDVLAGREVAVKAIGVGDRNHKQHDFYKKVQHKGLVAYYNSFCEGPLRYLVLQYFPLTLSAYLRTHAIPPQQAKHVFKGLASTLHFLHGMAIAHRDVKLENIVVSEDLRQVKFIDFGLCIDLNQTSSTLCRQFCGTVHYMPPQILEKRPYAPKKADVWSLGVLLYRLLLDRFPFKGRDQRELALKIYRSKLVFAEWMEADLQSLLRGMLRKEPEGRWDMGQVMEHSWLR